MNFNTPMFLYDLFSNRMLVFPLSQLLEAIKDKRICLHCKHFHQTQDWREVPEGAYLPKGTCSRCPPWDKNRKEHHAGTGCDLFERKEQ